MPELLCWLKESLKMNSAGICPPATRTHPCWGSHILGFNGGPCNQIPSSPRSPVGQIPWLCEPHLWHPWPILPAGWTPPPAPSWLQHAPPRDAPPPHQSEFISRTCHPLPRTRGWAWCRIGVGGRGVACNWMWSSGSTGWWQQPPRASFRLPPSPCSWRHRQHRVVVCGTLLLFPHPHHSWGTIC